MPVGKISKPRVSCTECRRRKQKCDRRWPCTHCRKRRTAQSCSYDSNNCTRDGTRKASQESAKSKWKLDEADESSEVALGPTLQALGYSTGVRHFNIGHANQIPPECADASSKRPSLDDVQQALRTLPGRSLIGAESFSRCLISADLNTDGLVQYYLHKLNYSYYSIHPASFLADYEDFFRDQLTDQPVDPTFLGLLLQICANAAQCADEKLQDKIKYDLAENAHDFSKRLQKASTSLGGEFGPGSGGLNRITQYLVVAAWFKGEARFVDAWHALAVSVHEAQECGFTMSEKGMPARREIDQELARRAWCFMVIWDWQMAEWLDRPMLIDTRAIPCFTLTAALDGEAEDTPSPFEGTFQQYKLIHSVATNHGRLCEVKDGAEIEVVQDRIANWRENLPVFLHPDELDRSWDSTCSWLPLQRALLHCFSEMVKFTPLKSLLTSDSSDKSRHLEHLAIQTGIHCISTATKLHEVLSPVRLEFHFVVFALFDTAAILCSALLRVKCGSLSYRREAVDAVHSALRQLDQLSESSKPARSSSKVLRYLISRLPCSVTNIDLDASCSTSSPESTNALSKMTGSEQASNASTQFADQSSLVLDFDLGTLDNLDFGGMEDIWNWDGLGVEWPLTTVSNI